MQPHYLSMQGMCKDLKAHRMPAGLSWPGQNPFCEPKSHHIIAGLCCVIDKVSSCIYYTRSLPCWAGKPSQCYR